MCNTQQTALDPQKDIIVKTFLVPDIFKTEIISSHHVTTINVNEKDLKFYLYKLFNTVTTALKQQPRFPQYVFSAIFHIHNIRECNPPPG